MFFVVLLVLMVIANNAHTYSNPQEYSRIRPVIRSRYVSSTTITIPIMLHIDKALKIKFRKHKITNTKKLRKFSLRLLSDAEYNFRKLSDKHEIKLKLIKARFLKDTNLTKMYEDASKYLKSYCNWQASMKWKKHSWYYSVLLTGQDLHYVDSEKKIVTASTGRSYTNGACSFTKSCSIVEWKPGQASYLLTHELAHGLGVNHDGLPKNKCKPLGHHMMTSKYTLGKQPRIWTQCNKRDFRKYITSNRATCLFADENRRFRNN